MANDEVVIGPESRAIVGGGDDDDMADDQFFDDMIWETTNMTLNEYYRDSTFNLKRKSLKAHR